MRLLADMHISPRSVEFLRTLGHDTVRVNEILSASATDEEIVVQAMKEARVILTQDLGFSAIIAVAGKKEPSLISLRLSSSRVEYVNAMLQKILPLVEQDVPDGTIVMVEDHRLRHRRLPLT